MDTKAKKVILWLTVVLAWVCQVESICPTPDTILPCICTNKNDDVQIWCTHSDLQQVSKGLNRIGEFLNKPIDELIIENNYLPSLPGKIFQNVEIQRLMLRHNGLQSVSGAWLETQENNIVEIFVVENELKSIPPESLAKLQKLEAMTIHSDALKRIPQLKNIPRLKYINIQSENLSVINGNTFANLPNLERLYIHGSANLRKVDENAFFNLPNLEKLEITDCGIKDIHMRGLSLLPNLRQLSLSNNDITDATMIGRAIRDLQTLSLLNLNSNAIETLTEGAFVDQTMLETIYLSHNDINVIHHGAFHRVPKLRIVDLNYNNIIRIHPESFLLHSSSGVEELSLIGNKIMHISEFRALLDALPRLKFLDMSDNFLQDIPRGALRGHPSLERLHLDGNNIKLIEADAFIAMPALRELHLSRNSLSDINEGPFWNLPNLKGLDLSSNLFRRLQPKLLYNLPSLRRFNLSHNKLTVIDPFSFVETPLLEFINISSNALVSIHPATFRNLANLYELDAGENKLIEFVPGLPRGLEQVNLRRNQITNLPVPPSPDLDLPSLRTLDISNNGIQRIPRGSFQTLHNLRRLYISRNGLRQIDDSTFNDLGRLELLDISFNQIIFIHLKSLTKLVHLKQIKLHGNSLENFDLIITLNNKELSVLDVSKNKLKSINQVKHDKALETEVLNISSNNIYELPETLTILPKLKIFDANYNNIKNFNGNIFNNAQSLKEIKLAFNKILQIGSGSFSDLKHLETIVLESNKIEIIHSGAFAKLPNVLSIYLSGNHIIDIPDRVFINLPKLRIMELQGNRLQFISVRAFETTPLVQYLNVSHNQLTNLDNSGIRHLHSLEVLDISYNKLMKITNDSFQYMEWLIELNLDNNLICHINGQPFNNMPRLKVLSIRNNKLTAVAESVFQKLRNNIAILDINGNPLTCNCGAIWLKLWLLESSSVGPKCSDGTYVKGMPFTRKDCLNVPVNIYDTRQCIIHENEALLPNLATSQVFSSSDRINGYVPKEKNDLQLNRINTRPTPEESEYFYDDYVDYPFNETVMDALSNHSIINKNNENQQPDKETDSGIKNTTAPIPTPTANIPRSGFTFFGMPLPSLDMSKLLNTGRKIDWHEKQKTDNGKYKSHVHETPKFESGGFTPMLPTTDGGFMPVDPTVAVLADIPIAKHEYLSYQSMGSTERNVAFTDILPAAKTNQSNAVHSKTKSEIHEVKAYINKDNNTQIAFINRTKNIEGQEKDLNIINMYHSMESNFTIAQVTEKEIIITTDTSNDMSAQAWIESTTSVPYNTSLEEALKPYTKNHIRNQARPLSSLPSPNNEEVDRRDHRIRPATITKVILPHLGQSIANSDLSAIYNNREPKTRFANTRSRTKNADDKDWYYKNYNISQLESYIPSDVRTYASNSSSYRMSFVNYVIWYHVIVYNYMLLK